MKKKIIRDRIIQDSRRPGNVFRFKDLIEYDLQPDDIISVGFRDEEDYSDSHIDACENLEIWRERLENDEEFERRKHQEEIIREQAQKHEYEHYLKLKKKYE